jgi:Fe-S cluster biogenesis protein NfuA
MRDGRREFSRRSERIEELVCRLESAGDPVIHAIARELVQAVIELHGIALDRILGAVSKLPHCEAALSRIAEDELVSNVLSLHDIHPVAIETRVAAALEKTQPYLRSHGGNVELASVRDGTVYVRLQGTCGSCSSSDATLKSTVESAIYEAAPEVVAVVAEPTPQAAPSNLITLQTK